MKNDVNRYVYTPKVYMIDQHPLIAGRRPTLSPETKCLWIERKAQKEAMAIGSAFEEKLAGLIRTALPAAKVYTDVYFESGIYHPEMMMYESVQIDLLVVLPTCIVLIEAKSLFDDKYEFIADGPDYYHWVLKERNSSVLKKHYNGVTQNLRHEDFIRQLFKHYKLDVPAIKRVVAFGGIDESKIFVRTDKQSYICHEDEIVDLLKELDGKYLEPIDVDKVCAIIERFRVKNARYYRCHNTMVNALSKGKFRLNSRCKPKFHKFLK